jgi:hypothetical protein
MVDDSTWLDDVTKQTAKEKVNIAQRIFEPKVQCIYEVAQFYNFASTSSHENLLSSRDAICG